MNEEWKLEMKSHRDNYVTLSLRRPSDETTFYTEIKWRDSEWNSEKGYYDYTSLPADTFRAIARQALIDLEKEVRSWEAMEQIIQDQYVDLSAPNLYFQGYH